MNLNRILLLCVVGLLLLAGVFFVLNGDVLSQSRNEDSYTVRVYNVDDLATVYVNGNQIIQVGYKGADRRYITNLLRPGKNEVRFVLRNDQEGFTYGFELSRGNEVIYSYECGLVDNSGCSKSWQTGIVFDRTITITYAGAIPSNSVAYNYPVSNAFNTVAIATNTVASAVNVAANSELPTLRKRDPDVTDIRKVDFRNFAFSECDGWYGPTPKLTNGRQQYGESQYDVINLKAVKYIDFDGDGRQEAFVTLDWLTSGSSGGGMNAYVYSIRSGYVESLWSKCNERSGFVLIGRTILYNYPEYIGDDAHCCPSYLTTDTYAWRGNGFVRISKKRKASGYK